MNQFKWFSANIINSMLIYLPNTLTEDFDKLCTSKTSLISSKTEMMFYSDYGIFTLRCGVFYKFVIETKKMTPATSSNNELLIDDSVISYNRVFSQIPSDYIAKTVNYNRYIIGDSSDIEFVVVRHDGLLFDSYISTSMKNITPIFEKVLSSFLFE